MSVPQRVTDCWRCSAIPAHENDVRRAVLAGLEITRAMERLSAQAKRRFRIEITVRVGVHRGLVYLDTATDDV